MGPSYPGPFTTNPFLLPPLHSPTLHSLTPAPAHHHILLSSATGLSSRAQATAVDLRMRVQDVTQFLSPITFLKIKLRQILAEEGGRRGERRRPHSQPRQGVDSIMDQDFQSVFACEKPWNLRIETQPATLSEDTLKL